MQLDTAGTAPAFRRDHPAEHQRGCCVGALPESQWLSLHDAVSLVAECCQCDQARAQTALLGALQDGAVTARGILPLSTLRDPWARGRNPETSLRNLEPGNWFIVVDWERGRVGRFREVQVERSSLKQWLPKAAVRGPGRRAADAEVRRIVEQYIASEYVAGKSTNTKRLWSFVAHELPSATREQAEAALHAIEGGRKKQGRPRKKNPRS